MQIIPIGKNNTNFGSYYPLTEEEIHRSFGKHIGKYLNKAMEDLVRTTHTDGAGLDVMVRTIENKETLKKGITIAVVDEKSNACFDYIRYENMKNCPHVKGSILLENVPKLELLSKIACDTAKELIDTFKACRKKPSLFEYYSKIYK